MNWITHIRQQYHISREELAMLLRVSGSLVRKAEAGTRTLPAAAVHKLLSLENACQVIPSSEHNRNETFLQAEAGSHNKNIATLKKHIRFCRHTLQLLEERLEQMQEQHANALQMLHMITAYRQHITATPTEAALLSWINGQEAVAMLRLHKYSLHAISLLQVKAAGLRAEIAAAEGLV